MGIRQGPVGLPQECSSREQSGFRVCFAFCSLLRGGFEVYLASRDLFSCVLMSPSLGQAVESGHQACLGKCLALSFPEGLLIYTIFALLKEGRFQAAFK